MRITIKTKLETAIILGKNSQQWDIELNIETLTAEQRAYLAYKMERFTYDKSLEYNSDYMDAAGGITPESLNSGIKIKAKMDEKQQREHEEREKRHEQNVLEWLAAPDSEKVFKESGAYARGWRWRGDNTLSSEDVRVQAERARLRAICNQKEAEDAAEKLRSEQILAATDKRKIAQLTEVVTRLGTDLQKQKWAAGLMARSEVINLLWAETFAPLETEEISAYKTDAYIHEQVGVDYQDCDWKQNLKETLTDSEFAMLEKVRGFVAPEDYIIYTEYDNSSGDDDDDDIERLTFARLCKTVGEYTLKCDVILS